MFGLKRDKKPAQPRAPDGTFGSTGAAKGIDKTVESETKAISATMDVMAGITKLQAAQDDALTKRDALINARVEALLNAGYEAEGPESDGLLAVAAPVIQSLAPYIGPYLAKILGTEAPLNVMPTASGQPSPTPAPPDMNVVDLIKQAATHDAKTIKLAMPIINSKLKEQGIEPALFKQAVLNLAKAV